MSNQQSSLLRDLLGDPRFRAVREVASTLQNQWALPAGTRKRATEFETLWEMAKTEGKLEGIDILFNKLEAIATDESD